MATTADMREIGVSGLKQSHGHITEEFLRELQGSKRWRIYREMQQDAVIGGVLLAIELSLRQVATNVTPADDTPAAQEIADFVDGCLDDMSASWADTLSEVLTMLPFGFEYSELVYKRRMGDNKDAGKSSKYTDGRIGWRKWAGRSQDSLDRWEIDDRGGLQGMWQYQDVGAPVLIPIDKALLFRTRANKGNPEGASILRTAYESYYYKCKIARIEAIGIERDTAGLPVVYMPPEYMSRDATDNQKALFAAMKELVTNIRRDEQEGVIMPLAYEEGSSNKLFELTLLSSGGQRQFDTDTVIARYNQQMAMSMLADFIMLGHEQVGSYALSATKSSLFKTALEAYLLAIANVINMYAIPRLMRLNGMAMELTPTLTFGRVGEIDLEDVIAWVDKIAGAGGQIFPHLATENYLRSLVGLEPLSEEEYTDREEENKAQQEADRQAKQRQPMQPQDGQGDGGQMSRAQAALIEASQRIVARGRSEAL